MQSYNGYTDEVDLWSTGVILYILCVEFCKLRRVCVRRRVTVACAQAVWLSTLLQ